VLSNRECSDTECDVGKREMSLNGPGGGNWGCDMVLTSRLERLYGSTDDEKGVGGMSGRVL
jgi:hypothetical protein